MRAVAGASRDPPACGCRPSGSTTATSPGSSPLGLTRRAGPGSTASALAWRYVHRLGRMVQATIAPCRTVALGAGERRRRERGPRAAGRGPRPLQSRAPRPRRRDAPAVRAAGGAARALRRPARGGEGPRPAAVGLAGGRAAHRRPPGARRRRSRRAIAAAEEGRRPRRLASLRAGPRSARRSLRRGGSRGGTGSAETFGLAALEALASGVPVLSADRGGVAETVAGPARAGCTPRATRRISPKRPSGSSERTFPPSAGSAGATPRSTTAGTPVRTACSRRTAASSPGEPAGLHPRRHSGAGGGCPAPVGDVRRARASRRRCWWFPTGTESGRSDGIVVSCAGSASGPTAAPRSSSTASATSRGEFRELDRAAAREADRPRDRVARGRSAWSRRLRPARSGWRGRTVTPRWATPAWGSARTIDPSVSSRRAGGSTRPRSGGAPARRCGRGDRSPSRGDAGVPAVCALSPRSPFTPGLRPSAHRPGSARHAGPLADPPRSDRVSTLRLRLAPAIELPHRPDERRR